MTKRLIFAVPSRPSMVFRPGKREGADNCRRISRGLPISATCRDFFGLWEEDHLH